ncbi:MAG TPA: hypothetical protein VK997_13315, partial [Deferrisomatales bacterium]|nr:hypothetical protein [Deferrisomatales bacterium]
PTGDKSRALGSLKVDWGAGILLEKTVGSLTFYANGDVIVPGDAFSDQGFTLRPFFAAVGAAEFRASKAVSVVAQVRTGTLAVFRKQVTDVLLGMNWAPTPGLVLQFGFAEDVLDSAAYSADLSLFLNATRRW